MTNQEIIDKYIHKVQRMQVPIELHSYLHRMLNDARRDSILEAKNMVTQLKHTCKFYDSFLGCLWPKCICKDSDEWKPCTHPNEDWVYDESGVDMYCKTCEK